MVESGVTDVTNVTGVTNVTDVTNGCVTKVTRNNQLLDSIFGDSTFEKILRFLYENEGDFTYDKIAEALGKTKDVIKMTLSRKNEYFEQKKPDGKVVFVTLVTNAIEEINRRISSYNSKIEQKRETLAQQKNVAKRHEEIIEEFKQFFELMKLENGFFDKKYSVINIDFMKLAETNLILADELGENPEETMKLFALAVEEKGIFENVNVRIYNLPKDRKINVEQIRHNHLNELISLSGRVVTLSDVRPQVVNAKFECPSCGTIISVLQSEKKFREPTRCSCGRRGSFRLISKKMISTARLILEDLQEKTDNPHAKRLNCFLKEDLLSYEKMNLYEPGTEIELVGILKEVPVSLKQGGMSTIFDLALEINSVSRMEEEISVENLTEDEIDKIQILAAKIDSNGINSLTESFAPDIYGHDFIKQAVCLQLASKKNEIGKKSKPNILLIGDPGSAKSKLGEFAVSITPGARRSVGGSASAVGLTGAVVRDDYSGGWRLEPGASVLARDFYMVDELNNVRDEDKPKLQELLSEHTITFDKATIHAKLKALAGVLATANPVHGLFKDNEDLVKQFNLTPPIINRFDLIFVVRDYVDEKTDRLIAKRMNDREMNKITSEYDFEFLKRFFVYVKEQNNPEIPQEISEKISKIYAKLRKYKTDSLNINPRVHVAFLQLCKASAKIRLSDKVEEKDLQRALEILSYSYFKTPRYESFDEEIN